MISRDCEPVLVFNYCKKMLFPEYTWQEKRHVPLLTILGDETIKFSFMEGNSADMYVK